MPVAPVLLSQAPATFLPEMWEPYRAQFQTDLQALDHMLNAAYWVVETERMPDSPDAARRRTISKASYDIVHRLKTMLGDGSLRATGVQAPSPLRVEIPAERWSTLRAQYSRDEAADERFTFIEVQIGRNPGNPAIVQECIEWLSAQGEKPRKVLEDDARESFPEITTRQFTTAYAKVYGRRPGRPRKPSAN